MRLADLAHAVMQQRAASRQNFSQIADFLSHLQHSHDLRRQQTRDSFQGLSQTQPPLQMRREQMKADTD